MVGPLGWVEVRAVQAESGVVIPGCIIGIRERGSLRSKTALVVGRWGRDKTRPDPGGPTPTQHRATLTVTKIPRLD